MSRTRSSRLFDYWIGLVTLLGGTALFLSTHRTPAHLDVPVLVLLAVTVLAESMPLRLPEEMTISVSHSLTIAAVLFAGPTNAALVVTFSAISLQDLQERRPLKIVAFNVGQLWLSTIVAGWAYLLAGGTVIRNTGRDVPGVAEVLVPLLVLALLHFLLNTAFVSVAGALRSSTSPVHVWTENYLWMIPSQLVFAVVALAIAQLLAVSVVGLVLVVIPLVIARQFYGTYISRRAAYTESVRSLVAAIDAKDSYTCGHSERVAFLARRIAEEYGLKGRALDALELAALLHDLGKVGVSARILRKAGPLEATERRIVAGHPLAGARIASNVKFLAQVGGVIRAHHERFDGAGYPDGLTGAGIPVGARILSVADSFDAMTSRRAYRDELTLGEAVHEITQQAGRQFDPDVVAAFTRLHPAVLEQVLHPSTQTTAVQEVG